MSVSQRNTLLSKYRFETACEIQPINNAHPESTLLSPATDSDINSGELITAIEQSPCGKVSICSPSHLNSPGEFSFIATPANDIGQTSDLKQHHKRSNTRLIQSHSQKCESLQSNSFRIAQSTANFNKTINSLEMDNMNSSKSAYMDLSNNREIMGSIGRTYNDSEPGSVSSENTSQEPSPVDSDIVHSFEITSPHEPPRPPVLDDDVGGIRPPNSIRQQTIERQTNRIFPTTDFFTDYMEERLIRWRPSDSQFNIDATMNGMHPYQRALDENRNLSNVGDNTNNVFKSIGKWFNGMLNQFSGNDPVTSPGVTDSNINNISSDMNRADTANVTIGFSDNTHAGSDSIERSSDGNVTSSMMLSDEPNFEILSKLNLHQNSSKSIIRTAPLEMEQPSYTPNAFPFNENELNYEKRRNMIEEDLFPVNESNDALDPLLSDNYFVSCMFSTKNWFGYVSSECSNLY